MSDTIPVVYAVNNATLPHNGGQVPVRKGGHWPADDPIVQAYPDLFSADPRWGMAYTVEPDGYDGPPLDPAAAQARGIPIEQATAAPGETRTTRRPKQAAE